MIYALDIIGWLAAGFLLPYIIFIGFCHWKWKYLPSPPHSTLPVGGLKVTVVVVSRNEEKTIQVLLQSLAAQNYPKACFDVVVIDDHSIDGTRKAALSFAGRSGLSLNVVPLERQEKIVYSPKKVAIQQAATISKSDILLLTDADCLLRPGWIASHVSYYESFLNAKLVFGPFYFVESHPVHPLLNLEAINLSGAAAITNSVGMPTMCSGANLSYKRELIDELRPFDNNIEVASGDDEFMLHAVFSKYPGCTFYNNQVEGVVATLPPSSGKAFYFQRRRWSGKWKRYSLPWPQLLAIVVFAGNLGYMLAAFTFFVSGSISPLVLILSKWLAEGFFSVTLCTHFERPKWLLFFFPMEIIYPFYAIFFGIAANFGKYQWKGRTYS